MNKADMFTGFKCTAEQSKTWAGRAWESSVAQDCRSESNGGQLEGHVLSSGFSHLAANNTAKETLCMIIQGFVLDSNKVSAGSLKIAPHFSEDVCWSFDFSAHFTSQSLSLMATAGLMMTPALLFSQTAAV